MQAEELSQILNTLSQKSSGAEVVKLANELSKTYRSDQKTKELVIDSYSKALSYAISRMPATYAVSQFVMEQLAQKLTDFPQSIVDIGSGTGSASFACLDRFEHAKVLGLEKSKFCRQVATELATSLGAEQKIAFESFDLTKDNLAQKCDMIVCAYVLNELPEKDFLPALEKLFASTNDLLVVIEPGTPKDFNKLLTIKRLAFKKGYNILAPCENNCDCNLSEDDWCNFSTRVRRTSLHRQAKGGSLGYEDEKFCYVAISKKQLPKPGTRVTRHPVYKPKQVLLEVCTPSGKQTMQIVKSDTENYKRARKVKVGEEL